MACEIGEFAAAEAGDEALRALVALLEALAGVAEAFPSPALAGRTISAHTTRTIGSTQSAFRPNGDGDISDGDETW